MAHTSANQKKKDVRIEIQTADNGGVIVNCSWTEDKPKDCDCGNECGHSPMDYKRKQYVYGSLDVALKEIPGMISVKQDLDPSDDIDRKMMKETEKEEDY